LARRRENTGAQKQTATERELFNQVAKEPFSKPPRRAIRTAGESRRILLTCALYVNLFTLQSF